MDMESGLIHVYQPSPKDRSRSYLPNQVALSLAWLTLIITRPQKR